MYLQENPAARLYDILSEAKKISAAKPASKFKEVWAKVFEVTENDLDEILQGISNVQFLYRQTRELISNNEKLNNKRNHAFLDKIYSAIYILNLQGAINAFNQHLTTETLTALAYMADTIEILFNLDKSLVTKDERVELIHKIDELVDGFINSDLPEDLISVCTENLMNIKNALVHYKIYGAKGLEESTSKAIGKLYLRGNSLANHQKDENINRFFTFVERIKLLLETPESLSKIPSTVKPIITFFLNQ